jgi:hypothetical protein
MTPEPSPSIAVFAVNERLDFVLETYPHPWPIFIDRAHLGPWVGFKGAATLALERNPDASHVLLLQDDLTFCRNFETVARDVIASNPTEPLSLFSPYGRHAQQAQKAGHRWYRRKDAMWGQATVWPRALVEPLIAFGDRMFQDDFIMEDTRIAAFLLEARRPMWYTVPALVQHAGAARSMIGLSNKQRIAEFYLGDQDPPLGTWVPTGEELTQQVRGLSAFRSKYRPDAVAQVSL